MKNYTVAIANLFLIKFLAGSRRRVLAVNCDPQGGLTLFFIPAGWTKKRCPYDMIMGDVPNPIGIDRGGILFDFIPVDISRANIRPTLFPGYAFVSGTADTRLLPSPSI